MPTPAEKKALIFLAAVAVAGAAVRATGAAARAETADDASREALRRQIVAVESAGAAGRKGKDDRTPKAVRQRNLQGDGTASGYGARSGSGDDRLTGMAPPANEIDPRSIFAKPPEVRAPERTGRQPEKPAQPIDVDVATVEELERLPRIGPALAERIVQDRQEYGAFGSLSGLQRVRGIGPSMARALSTYVTFSGTPRPSIAGGPGASAGTERTRKTHVRAGSAPDRHRRRPVPP
jgi:competence protein ComEA